MSNVSRPEVSPKKDSRPQFRAVAYTERVRSAPGRGWRRRAAVVAVLATVMSAGYVSAQRGFRAGARLAPEDLPDREFTICRIMFSSVRTGAVAGQGWQTDYPLGDNNLMVRFSELTRARVSMDEARRWFDALSKGGQVIMPFAETFWSPGYGNFIDKFGVPWMVNVIPSAGWSPPKS